MPLDAESPDQARQCMSHESLGSSYREVEMIVHHGEHQRSLRSFEFRGPDHIYDYTPESISTEQSRGHSSLGAESRPSSPRTSLGSGRGDLDSHSPKRRKLDSGTDTLEQSTHPPGDADIADNIVVAMKPAVPRTSAVIHSEEQSSTTEHVRSHGSALQYNRERHDTNSDSPTGKALNAANTIVVATSVIPQAPESDAEPGCRSITTALGEPDEAGYRQYVIPVTLQMSQGGITMGDYRRGSDRRRSSVARFGQTVNDDQLDEVLRDHDETSTSRRDSVCRSSKKVPNTKRPILPPKPKSKRSATAQNISGPNRTERGKKAPNGSNTSRQKSLTKAKSNGLRSSRKASITKPSSASLRKQSGARNVAADLGGKSLSEGVVLDPVNSEKTALSDAKPLPSLVVKLSAVLSSSGPGSPDVIPPASNAKISGSPSSTSVDPQLLRQSTAIMQKTRLEDKPKPRGEPEVWADSRQALCETVLYYQSWQGACYTKDGVLYSFMFDNNGHSRDLMDEDIIIARAGGAMVKDRVTGEMVQSRDQKDNRQTDAVRNAILQQNPVVIFCGSKNADAPSSMPHRYCSLGWFKVTHVWSEMTMTKKCEALENIKYRFEKLDLSRPSWWAPKEEAFTTVKVGDIEPPLASNCQSCGRRNQQIYLEGWMCLSSSCPAFWRLPNGATPDDAELNYDPRFLKQKTVWKNESPPYAIRPALPNPSSRAGDDVSYAMTRGLCCPKCGKCTSRHVWRGWVCSNSACDFDHIPSHTLITAASIRDPWHPLTDRYAQSIDWVERANIQTSVEFSHNYRIIHYQLEGVHGRISHMIANKVVNEETRGPDDIFEALQTLDVGLERRNFASGKEDFMTAFSGNWGMPYKFVASGDSQSFEGAPWPLPTTRTRLNWAARKVVGPDFTREAEFNELLTFGYFDGQNINYHDDGEYGLGETVATLSLGNPANMYFRVKGKHFTGVSKSGVFIDKMPLPGTNDYEKRKAAFERLQQEDLQGSARQARFRQIAKELDLKSGSGNTKPCIRLRLSHGDVVIMHGRAIQEYMEHQVDPLGSLRFALTCRTVLADHLKPDELPKYEVKPDDGFYDGSAIAETRD